MALSNSSSDPDFERPWSAWKAGGPAHDRIVRRRFVVSASVIATIAAGGLIAYRLLPW